MLRTFLLILVTVFVTLFVYNSALPPISTLMITHTLSFHRITRDYVPLSRMSPALPRAVIAAEDGRFCEHWGVDWKALGNAVEDLADDDRDRVSGASTITMQLTKNLFLWPGRSYLRKGVEIPLALGLDLIWSKRRIMDRYLNMAEFGPGIFGAEAASRYYFHKSVRNLTPREAALLAATLPNPKKRRANRPNGYMAGYASRIESRAWQQDTSCLK